MTPFSKLQISLYGVLEGPNPKIEKGPKKFPQTFRRDVQCQKSSNMTYFHIKLANNCPRKMGHKPKEIDPTNYQVELTENYPR